ncbi:MAG: polysaccharide pyruvyl transferase family protein [Thermoleophilia bacterium]|nr:polysaccharide pyruvyl transferase family protein [Thermoleophilia bacterium]
MRYLVSGYYGEKNAGDEAILAGILQEIERRDPQACFTVFSFDPADTERRHGAGRRLEAVSTSLRSPSRIRIVMRTADLLISGGGSFLHEADFELHGRSFLLREGKLRPLPYFLSIVLMARAQGLPVMWYAQGLGPLHTLSARRMVARAASASQAVTWRDPGSARLAYEVGVRAPVQLVVPDPAYALTPADPAEAQAELGRCGMAPGSRYLAVCPRPWLGRTGYLEALGEALEQAGAALDLEILLVPFHEIQDPPVCETLAARPGFAGRAHVLPPVSSPALLAAVLGAAELVVAMRLHSGILAATAGTPAVVVDYDPKTRAFARQTGQLWWTVKVDDLERAPAGASGGGAGQSAAAARPSGAQDLIDAIIDTANDLPARRAALARAVAPLRAEAGRTAGLAVQLATAGKVPAGPALAGGAGRGSSILGRPPRRTRRPRPPDRA